MVPANLEHVNKYFFDWLIGSIKLSYEETKKENNNGSPIICFMLLSSAVDVLAGFYSGRETIYGTRDQYIRFCDEYLKGKGYESMLLYHGIRCELVHNFSLAKNIFLTHDNCYDHLKLTKEGAVTINLDNFIEDVESAALKYFNDVKTLQPLQDNFEKRFKAFSFITPTSQTGL